MNMRLCEFYQDSRYETAISDFQLLSSDFFVIRLIVIPQNTRVNFASLSDQNLLIFKGKRMYGRHIGSVISKSEFIFVLSKVE